MARVAATPQVMVALTGFVGAINGKEISVPRGAQFTADDPVVRKWPHLFGPANLRTTTPPVEQATAAPGEKRGA